MNEIYKLTREELVGINDVLIKRTNLKGDNPCFCGEQKVFSDCCKQKPNFWIIDTYVQSLIRFAQSQKWQVDKVPFLVGKNSFEDYYLQSHDSCARLGCRNSPTVNSHVYGKKHVEKYLTENVCKIHNPYRDSEDFFTEVNTGREITFRVFCESCESIFLSIDSPDHDTDTRSNDFLHLLRTQSYQYQFVRQDLALAHQVFFLKPILEEARYASLGRRETDLSRELNWFIGCNIRYQYQSRLRNKLWYFFVNSHNSTKMPYVHSRKIECKHVFFSSGISNPSHDLNRKKLSSDKASAIFYYAVPSDINHMTITIASFDSEYQDMLNQLAGLNDYAFRNYFNHLITVCSLPLSLVLPDSFKVTNQMISKIKNKKELIQKTPSQKPSDLKSRKIFAKFLK